jgi:hypothetical protein
VLRVPRRPSITRPLDAVEPLRNVVGLPLHAIHNDRAVQQCDLKVAADRPCGLVILRRSNQMVQRNMAVRHEMATVLQKGPLPCGD